jgi:hypothetical protein
MYQGLGPTGDTVLVLNKYTAVDRYDVLFIINILIVIIIINILIIICHHHIVIIIL